MNLVNGRYPAHMLLLDRAMFFQVISSKQPFCTYVVVTFALEAEVIVIFTIAELHTSGW